MTNKLTKQFKKKINQNKLNTQSRINSFNPTQSIIVNSKNNKINHMEIIQQVKGLSELNLLHLGRYNLSNYTDTVYDINIVKIMNNSVVVEVC